MRGNKMCVCVRASVRACARACVSGGKRSMRVLLCSNSILAYFHTAPEITHLTAYMLRHSS